MEHRQHPTPQYGAKPVDLSQPPQRDLTPEEASRTLQPSRETGEEEQDPISKGRGGLEILFYGIMLLAVVAFQLLSHYEPRENGEATPFDDPRVTSITVDNRHAGTREEIEGDVVSKPDCPSGSEATIQPRVREVDGTAFGRIQLNAENRNGEWQIMASGLLSGLARIHAEVEVDCRSTANEEPE